MSANSLNLANDFTDDITAGTTQTQAGATALTTSINIVQTVGTDDDGVALPKAIKGRTCFISNRDAAQDIQVWPKSGSSDTIEDGSANAVWGVSIGELGSAMFIATSGTETDAGNWEPVLGTEGATA